LARSTQLRATGKASLQLTVVERPCGAAPFDLTASCKLALPAAGSHALRAEPRPATTSQRTTAVAGSTDRKTLIALLRRNANLIKEMRVQLKPYQSSPTKHAVWLRLQGYTRLIVLGGGGAKGGPAPKPAA
jgi:hypothetical protein